MLNPEKRDYHVQGVRGCRPESGREKKETAYAQYPNIEACPSTWPECGSGHLRQWHRWRIESPLDFPKLDSRLTHGSLSRLPRVKSKNITRSFYTCTKGRQKRPRLVVIFCSQLPSRSHHLQPDLTHLPGARGSIATCLCFSFALMTLAAFKEP